MSSKRARCIAPVSPEPTSTDGAAGAAPQGTEVLIDRSRPGPLRRAVARAAAASRAAHGASVPF